MLTRSISISDGSLFNQRLLPKRFRLTITILLADRKSFSLNWPLSRFSLISAMAMVLCVCLFVCDDSKHPRPDATDFIFFFYRLLRCYLWIEIIIGLKINNVMSGEHVEVQKKTQFFGLLTSCLV